jgi:hypothetical protein
MINRNRYTKEVHSEAKSQVEGEGEDEARCCQHAHG